MRFPKSLTAPLLALPLLLAASGCAKQAAIQPAFPPAADLAVEAKPVPGDDIVTSAQAEAVYNAKVEGWGERGWAAVARICRWAKAQGAEISCPQ